VVVSIDPRRIYVNDPSETPFRTIQVSKPGPNGEKYAWYQCTVKGGREGRQIGAYELSKAVEELGAGEILLNCIDCDGRVHLSPSTFGYLTHSSAWQWWVLQ
jgi:glutamine amidotransferase/cyclase